MIACSRGRLLATVFIALLGADSVDANQQSRRFAWWKADSVVRELNLTAEQTARIDEVFQTMRVELRQELEELERLENKLSRLIETDAEEAQVVRAIDRVETARANLSKTRSLMLLRMRRVLTPEQRTGLTALQKRWDEESRHRETDSRRRSDDSPRPRRD
jgi:Spy/CpxP family protein refolding chaperone